MNGRRGEGMIFDGRTAGCVFEIVTRVGVAVEFAADQIDDRIEDLLHKADKCGDAFLVASLVIGQFCLGAFDELRIAATELAQLLLTLRLVAKLFHCLKGANADVVALFRVVLAFVQTGRG